MNTIRISCSQIGVFSPITSLNSGVGMDRLGVGIRKSERREFPWEREGESELDGNGNDSTGMGENMNGTVPVKGQKNY
jgi:hypothetical protein